MENLEAIKATITALNPDYLNLCSDFLILDSRFEYALKECGFLQSGNRVLTSIDNYTDSIKESFKHGPESQLGKAVNFTISNPPKIHINNNGNLIWQENPSDKYPIEVLPEYIRRVRNNLLHGGKFYGGIEIGSRNWNLISNSMIIIEN